MLGVIAHLGKLCPGIDTWYDGGKLITDKIFRLRQPVTDRSDFRCNPSLYSRNPLQAVPTLIDT